MLENKESIHPNNQEYERYEKRIDLVNELLSKAQYKDAQIELRKIISDGFERGFIYLALGDVSVQLQENARAKEYFNRAITIEPEDHQTVVAAKAGLGNLYLREALAEFKAMPPEAQLEELKSLIPDDAALCKKPLKTMLYYSTCLYPCVDSTGSYNKKRRTLTGCRVCY